MKKQHHKNKYHRLFLLKEIIFTFLAVASVALVIFDFIKTPTATEYKIIDQVDLVIAYIFLLDFCIELLVVSNRREYLRHNWYLLLAAIPLTDNITEALRGLRALRLIRIVRAGEHLDYDFKIKKESTQKNRR